MARKRKMWEISKWDSFRFEVLRSKKRVGYFFKDVWKFVTKVSLRHTAYRWVNYWITIAEGVVGVVTFTIIHPNWAYRHFVWYTKKQFEKTMKEQNL